MDALAAHPRRVWGVGGRVCVEPTSSVGRDTSTSFPLIYDAFVETIVQLLYEVGDEFFGEL